MILMMSCCYIISEIINNLFNLKEQNTYFYYLVLNRDNEKTHWRINGLCPQYSKPNYPNYYCEIPFNIKNLDPIIMDLETFWYSTEKPDKEYWKHQWLKYGTYMFNKYNNYNEYDYFKQVLSSYVDVLQQNVIDKYPLEQNGTQVKIPIDLDFKIILPSTL